MRPVAVSRGAQCGRRSLRWGDLFDLADGDAEDAPAEEAGAHRDRVQRLRARPVPQLRDGAHPTVGRADAETFATPRPVPKTRTAGPNEPDSARTCALSPRLMVLLSRGATQCWPSSSLKRLLLAVADRSLLSTAKNRRRVADESQVGCRRGSPLGELVWARVTDESKCRRQGLVVCRAT